MSTGRNHNTLVLNAAPDFPRLLKQPPKPTTHISTFKGAPPGWSDAPPSLQDIHNQPKIFTGRSKVDRVWGFLRPVPGT